MFRFNCLLVINDQLSFVVNGCTLGLSIPQMAIKSVVQNLKCHS